MQVGKHGLIIEFTDPDYNIRCSATYLPEVASHEGELIIFHLSNAHILILRRNLLSTYMNTIFQIHTTEIQSNEQWELNKKFDQYIPHLYKA